MIEQACRDMDLDPARSFMVGDRWLDVACGSGGRAAQSHRCVRTDGRGRPPPKRRTSRPRADAILNNLMEALGGFCAAPRADRRAGRAQRRRHRRRRGRRVRVRPRGAGLARGAGADPRIRLDRGRAGRRRQRGQQRGGARRPRGLVAVVGRDEPDALVARCTRASIIGAGCVAARAPHPVKTRILAGGIHSAKQQVVRIDRGVGRPIDERPRSAFERAALAARPKRDAVLMSDYGSGLVTPARVAQPLRRRSRRAGPRFPCSSTSRYRLLDSRADRLHAERIGGRAGARHPHQRQRTCARAGAGRELLEATAMQAVLITRGSRGMALFVPDRDRPAHPDLRLRRDRGRHRRRRHGDGDDDAGAGGGGDVRGAARLANYAGGIVVMKRGTATRVAERAARRRSPWVRLSRAEAARRASPMRARAVARSRLPTAASTCCTSATSATSRRPAQEADLLIVAINDDASVQGAEGRRAADPAGGGSGGAGGGAAVRRLGRRLSEPTGGPAARGC